MNEQSKEHAANRDEGAKTERPAGARTDLATRVYRFFGGCNTHMDQPPVGLELETLASSTSRRKVENICEMWHICEASI